MRKLSTILLCCICAFTAMAQNTISGKLLDTETGEALIGATILLEGTEKGTTTDIDGNFKLEDVPAGNQNLLVNYVGYQTLTVPVNASENRELGAINLSKDEKVLSEVEVIASIAQDRRTPVAVTTLKGEDIELKVGNQEYVEVLRKTPSVYVTKQGGGFGDSRINVRGFDQRNTAVMINGIPVNDMENGWVYWSNWAGLSDVTSKMQIQRGLGATKLAAPTVGGSINIITNAAELERKGNISFGVGNDAYMKAGITYSTGLMDNGLAASVQITRRQGDGYVDGTQFSAWSYFAAISKVFNDDHTISISAVGAPQWHHQRNGSGNFDNIFLQTFEDKGIKYNHTWGPLDGEEFNWRRNFYHKPKVFVNHYWDINSRTDLKTSAYVSFGRGGGTGPRGRLRTPGSVFDSYGGDSQGLFDANGQVRFDDLHAYNQGNVSNTDSTLQNWGEGKAQENGQYIVTRDGRVYDADGNRSDNGSGFVRRASMNYHNWYGALSTLTHRLTDELTLTTGIDGRYYKGEHFRRLENLMGADGYLSTADRNNPNNLITTPVPATFGNFFDNSYKNGNVLAYHNDGLVGWLGAFAQTEYVRNDLSAFVSLSGSSQSFKRIDYFSYYNDAKRDSISSAILASDGQAAADQWLDDNPSQESEWVGIFGGTVKAGANYNFGNSNVFVNAGYLSRQPIFDNVFLAFRNDVNEDLNNQIVTAFEAGYGLRTKYVDAKLNLYNTKWANQTFNRGEQFALIATSDTIVDMNSFAPGDTLKDAYGDIIFESGQAIFRNVDQRHRGIEIEAFIKPAKRFSVDLTLSLGDWKYTKDFIGEIFDDNQDKVGEATLYVEDQPIGDAAQTTFSIGATVKPIDGLRVYADWFLADRLYAQFRINEDKFRQPGGEILELPAYSLLDAGASYSIPFGNYRVSVYANVNNVLNSIYVSEMFTNNPDDPTTADVNEFYTENKGFYGYGRTWNTGLKFQF